MATEKTEKKPVPLGKIIIRNVRISYPHLFDKQKAQGDGEPSYNAAFILPKNHPQLSAIREKIDLVAQKIYKDKWKTILASLKAKSHGGLQDGDTKPESAGYEGNYFFNANNKTAKIDVRDRDKSNLTKDDGKLLDGGDYVNVSVEFWAMDHKDYGKRIAVKLLGVQYDHEGLKFGSGATADEDDFEDLGDIGDSDYQSTSGDFDDLG